MRITLATVNEIDRIMELIKSCIEDMKSQGIFQWDEHYPTAEIFEDDIRNGSLYLLKDQADCLGIISLNEDQSSEYSELEWLITKGKILVIHRLAVNPRWQRQGVARRLMDFAENYAADKGYSGIRLDAYSGNPRALNLYERRGYQKIGQVFFPRRELSFYGYEKVITKYRLQPSSGSGGDC